MGETNSISVTANIYVYIYIYIFFFFFFFKSENVCSWSVASCILCETILSVSVKVDSRRIVDDSVTRCQGRLTIV